MNLKLPFLSPDSIEQLRAKMLEVLIKIRPHLDEEDKKKNIHFRLFWLMRGLGGPKDMLELADGFIFTGIPDYNELRQSKVMSYEKALRLAAGVRRNPLVLSSFQFDRNRDEDRYGGAFRAQCTVPNFRTKPVWVILSIAGIGELADEAIGLRTFTGLPWKVDPRHIGDVRRASKNSLAERLLKT